MNDPIVIDPPGFDVNAAWGACSKYVEDCGGLSHEDGEPNWRAAAGADPGVCSCPACHEHYWAWGTRQKCAACGAEYETDWWAMLSWGVQHGRIVKDHAHPMHSYYMERGKTPDRHREKSAVYRWGIAHPDCSLDTRAVFKGTNWLDVWAGKADYVKEGEMVGGKVIGVVRCPDSTLLNVQDKNDVCAVRCVEVPGITIGIGDSVWWQAGKVYWTPSRRRNDYPRRGERPEDVPLVKVGYSH